MKNCCKQELSSGPGRGRNIAIWLPILTEWLADKTMEEVVAIFLAQGLPCGPVQTSADVANCPHIAKREMLVTIPDPVMGEITMVGSPIKMDDNQPVYGPAPLLGEHTAGVLSQILGYDDQKIAALRQRKVI